MDTNRTDINGQLKREREYQQQRKKNKRNKNSAQNVMVQIACKYKRGNKKCIQLHCAGNNMENITIVYIYFIESKIAPREKKQWGFLSPQFAWKICTFRVMCTKFFLASVCCVLKLLGWSYFFRERPISSIFHMLETTFHMGLLLFSYCDVHFYAICK